MTKRLNCESNMTSKNCDGNKQKSNKNNECLDENYKFFESLNFENDKSILDNKQKIDAETKVCTENDLQGIKAANIKQVDIKRKNVSFIENTIKVNNVSKDIDSSSILKLKFKLMSVIFLSLIVFLSQIFVFDFSVKEIILFKFLPVLLIALFNLKDFIQSFSFISHKTIKQNFVFFAGVSIILLYLIFLYFTSSLTIQSAFIFDYVAAAFFVYGAICLFYGTCNKSINEMHTAITKNYSQFVYKQNKNGEVSQIPLNQIVKGDILVADNFDYIVVDGIIEKGGCYIDEGFYCNQISASYKSIGDKVFSGCKNLKGLITYRVMTAYKDSTAEESNISNLNGLKTYRFVNNINFAFICCFFAFSIFYALVYSATLVELILALCFYLIIVGLKKDVSFIFLKKKIFDFNREGICFGDGMRLEKLSKTKAVVFEDCEILIDKYTFYKIYPVENFIQSDVFMFAASLICSAKHFSRKFAECFNFEIDYREVTLYNHVNVERDDKFAVSGVVDSRYVKVLTLNNLINEADAEKVKEIERLCDKSLKQNQAELVVYIDNKFAGLLSFNYEMYCDTELKGLTKLCDIRFFCNFRKAFADEFAKKLGVSKVYLYENDKHRNKMLIMDYNNEDTAIITSKKNKEYQNALYTSVLLTNNIDESRSNHDINIIKAGISGLSLAIKRSKAIFKKVKIDVLWTVFYSMTACAIAFVYLKDIDNVNKLICVAPILSLLLFFIRAVSALK